MSVRASFHRQLGRSREARKLREEAQRQRTALEQRTQEAANAKIQPPPPPALKPALIAKTGQEEVVIKSADGLFPESTRFIPCHKEYKPSSRVPEDLKSDHLIQSAFESITARCNDLTNAPDVDIMVEEMNFLLLTSKFFVANRNNRAVVERTLKSLSELATQKIFHKNSLESK